MWIACILASAFFLAVYDLAKKASVIGNEVLRVLLCSSAAGAAAFACWLAATGRAEGLFSLPARFYALVAVKVLIVSTSWILTYYALRVLPITVATPIRASAPLWIFIAALFLYGEVPTLLQSAGLLLAFGGYLAFSAAGKVEGIDFLRSRGVWFATAGMFCSAASGLYDKWLFQVQALPRFAAQFWFQTGLVAVYGVWVLAQRALRIRHARFEWRWTIPAVGVLLALADGLYFAGLSVPGVPISVASVMRRTSVAITFLLGARFFHETNLWRKGVALAMILSGVALLCL